MPNTTKRRTTKQVTSDIAVLAKLHNEAILENHTRYHDSFYDWASELDNADIPAYLDRKASKIVADKQAVKQAKKDATITVIGGSSTTTMTFFTFRFNPDDIAHNLHNGAIDIKVRFETITSYGVRKGTLGTVRYNLQAEKFASYEGFPQAYHDTANKALANAVKHILKNRMAWTDIVVPDKQKQGHKGNKFYQWILALNPNYASAYTRKVAQESKAAQATID